MCSCEILGLSSLQLLEYCWCAFPSNADWTILHCPAWWALWWRVLAFLSACPREDIWDLAFPELSQRPAECPSKSVLCFCLVLDKMSNFSHVTDISSKLVFQGFPSVHGERKRSFQGENYPFLKQVWIRCQGVVTGGMKEETQVSWGPHAPSCHQKYLYLFRPPISVPKLDSQCLPPLCAPIQGNKEYRLRCPFFSPKSGFLWLKKGSFMTARVMKLWLCCRWHLREVPPICSLLRVENSWC